MGYLPDDSFLAVGPDSAAAALQQLRSVAWVGSPHPTDKLPATWMETTQWLSAHAASYSAASRPLDAFALDHGPLRHAQTVRLAHGRLAVVVEVELVPEAAPRPSEAAVAAAEGNAVREEQEGRRARQAIASRVLHAALATQWAEALGNITMGGVVVYEPPRVNKASVDGLALRLAVAVEHLSPAVHWLAAQGVAHHVTPHWRHRTANADAAAILQAGTVDVRTQKGYANVNPAVHPFWAAGLTGAGQVVGCGDTGLDLSSKNPPPQTGRRTHTAMAHCFALPSVRAAILPLLTCQACRLVCLRRSQAAFFWMLRTPWGRSIARWYCTINSTAMVRTTAGTGVTWRARSPATPSTRQRAWTCSRGLRPRRSSRSMTWRRPRRPLVGG